MPANQTPDVRTFSLDAKQRDYLERVVHNEAKGEGVEGRNAVRAVILNRLASGKYGKTVEEVVNQPKQFSGVPKNGGVAALPKAPNENHQELASFIRSGKDPTNGATYFLNPEIATAGFNEKYKGRQIGNHVFYNHYNGNKVEVPQYKVVLQQDTQRSPVQRAEAKKDPGLWETLKEKALALVPDSIEEKFTGRPAAAPKPEQKKSKGLLEWAGLAEGGTIQKGKDMAKKVKGIAAPEAEVPVGSLPEEVADDIPAMLSEGEYVIPADVVRWHGLKHIEEMRMEAKMGLMAMQMDGRLHEVDEEGEPTESDDMEDEGEDEGEAEDTEEGAEEQTEDKDLPFDIPEEWDSMEIGDGEVLILFKK